MGATMRSTVRNAARLAVYEEIRIRVKNHHTLPTMRPEIDLQTQGQRTVSAGARTVRKVTQLEQLFGDSAVRKVKQLEQLFENES
jgi:hypothetical protein